MTWLSAPKTTTKHSACAATVSWAMGNIVQVCAYDKHFLKNIVSCWMNQDSFAIPRNNSKNSKETNLVWAENRVQFLYFWSPVITFEIISKTASRGVSSALLTSHDHSIIGYPKIALDTQTEVKTTHLIASSKYFQENLASKSQKLQI